MDSGALFAMALVTLMLGWYADSWDTLVGPSSLLFFELSGVVIVPYPETFIKVLAMLYFVYNERWVFPKQKMPALYTHFGPPQRSIREVH